MKMKRFSTFYFGLLLCYFYFLVTGISVADQIPEKEKKVARNLHNEEMYSEGFYVLIRADNAYLSSSTVNLLKSALNDTKVSTI